MRAIAYTYDEENPTNKDYVIACLTDSIDDGGASYESLMKYNIACPYSGIVDCLNHHERNAYGTNEYEEECVRCKTAWLDRQYDTYPSDDGKWELEND